MKLDFLLLRMKPGGPGIFALIFCFGALLSFSSVRQQNALGDKEICLVGNERSKCKFLYSNKVSEILQKSRPKMIVLCFKEVL